MAKYGDKVYGWISIDIDNYWHGSHGTDPLECVEQSACCFESKDLAAENAAVHFGLSKDAEDFLAERGGVQICETREGQHVPTRSITLTEMILAVGTAK